MTRIGTGVCLLALLLGGCPEDSGAPPTWDGAQDALGPDLLRRDVWSVDADLGPATDGKPPDGAPPDVWSGPDLPLTPLFGDVPATHQHYEAIQWVGARGYMTGCTGGSPPDFCPASAAKRAELAVAVATMKFGTGFSHSQVPHFSDVPATHPAFAHVQKLADIGAVSGCSLDQFCPDADATRAQGATVVIKARYGDSFGYSTMPHFSDVPATHLSFKYIQKLKDAGIAEGCGAGKFCPDDPLLRQHLAAFLFRAQTL